MKIIDDNCNLFGFINVIDLAFIIFFFAIIGTIFVYTYSPPNVNETVDVVFQVFFVSRQYTQVINKGFAYNLFVVGNEFTPTMYGTKAVISDVYFIIAPDSDKEINVLVTLNGTLRISDSGKYIFNGLEIAPGKMINAQINNSYIRGTVQRVNYSHQHEKKEIEIIFINLDTATPNEGEDILNYDGSVIGTITSLMKINEKYYAILTLPIDIYDGIMFFQEYTLNKGSKIHFRTTKNEYQGIIVGEIS